MGLPAGQFYPRKSCSHDPQVQMKILLSTAYWPNLEYFSQVLKAEQITVEQYDHYEKQSYRNRCEILSANGPLSLSIPVSKDYPKTCTKDVRISYLEKWQHQ